MTKTPPAERELIPESLGDLTESLGKLNAFLDFSPDGELTEPVGRMQREPYFHVTLSPEAKGRKYHAVWQIDTGLRGQLSLTVAERDGEWTVTSYKAQQIARRADSLTYEMVVGPELGKYNADPEKRKLVTACGFPDRELFVEDLLYSWESSTQPPQRVLLESYQAHLPR